MFAWPLSTRETVMCETPAVVATWRMFGRSEADRVLTAPPSGCWVGARGRGPCIVHHAGSASLRARPAPRSGPRGRRLAGEARERPHRASRSAPARRPARLRCTEPSAPTAPCTHLSGRHVFLPGPPPPHPADHLGRPRLRRSLLAQQRGRPHPEPRPARRERDEVRQRLRHRPDLLPLPLGAHRRRPPAALGRALVRRLLLPARLPAGAARAAGCARLPHRLLRQDPLRRRGARRPRLPRAARLRLLLLRA